MDYFKRIFVVAFVASALALGVAFVAARRVVERKPAEEVLWRESIAQLKSLGDHKYRQSLHYMAYAKYAARDSLNAEAALFHAMSHADAVHCANCRKALEGLGGKATTPTISRTRFSSTTDHLRYALEDKHTLHIHLLQPAIEQALADNNRHIARMLTWCDASDIKQMLILRRAHSSQPLPHTYRICPTCGDIGWEEFSPRHCPHCMTDSAKFIRVHYPYED